MMAWLATCVGGGLQRRLSLRLALSARERRVASLSARGMTAPPGASAMAVACITALVSCLPSNARGRVPAVSGLAVSASPIHIAIRHRHHRHRRIREPGKAKPEESHKSDGDATAALELQKQPQQPSTKPSEPERPNTASKLLEPMGPPPPPETWTASEVEAGRKDCDRRLSGLQIVFERLDPIREGACGLPSPIRLNGLESQRAPELLFDPAPATSCRMAQALRRWFDEIVQPKAKAYLHATVVRMTTLSGYDCRSRYDDPARRLSQHAYGNALDVSEFVTAKGEHIALAGAWGAGDERAAFLRDIHDGACQIFGTVLGPDANDAHKNHFHLDMTERRRPLCDFTTGQARLREANKKAAAVPANDVKAPAGGDGKSAAEKPEKPVPAAATQDGAARMHRRHHRRIRS